MYATAMFNKKKKQLPTTPYALAVLSILPISWNGNLWAQKMTK
jgi:hypothetical protein